MLISRHQNAGKNPNIKIANRFFWKCGKVFITTVTDQYLIHEEIKSSLNSGSTCYHSVVSLLSKNVNINIYKLELCLWFSMGVKLWF
jgi:hypothetical protein